MLVAVPLQMVCDAGVAITLDVGLTVTSKLNGVPGQLVVAGPVGVITYLTTPGEVPVLSKVWLMLDPLPPAKPVTVPPDGVVVIDAVQVKVVPVVADVIVYPTAVLSQISFVAALLTVGVGLTVMVKDWAVPVQLTEPFVKVGVTVIVATTGAVPVLVAVKDGMVGVFVPLAANPMEVVLFVHE